METAQKLKHILKMMKKDSVNIESVNFSYNDQDGGVMVKLENIDENEEYYKDIVDIEYDLVLTDIGNDKIELIKAYRAISDRGLRVSKEKVESAPINIFKGDILECMTIKNYFNKKCDADFMIARNGKEVDLTSNIKKLFRRYKD